MPLRLSDDNQCGITANPVNCSWIQSNGRVGAPDIHTCVETCCHNINGNSTAPLQGACSTASASWMCTPLSNITGMFLTWWFTGVYLHHCAYGCLQVVPLRLLSVEDLYRVQPTRHLQPAHSQATEMSAQFRHTISGITTCIPYGNTLYTTCLCTDIVTRRHC